MSPKPIKITRIFLVICHVIIPLLSLGYPKRGATWCHVQSAGVLWRPRSLLRRDAAGADLHAQRDRKDDPGQDREMGAAAGCARVGLGGAGWGWMGLDGAGPRLHE